MRTTAAVGFGIAMALTTLPACLLDQAEMQSERPLPEIEKEGGSPIVVEGTLAPDMRLDGEFEITTRFALKGVQSLPFASPDPLSTLSDLGEDPSTTLLQLLVDDGAPIAGVVADLVPEDLEVAVFQAVDAYFAGRVYESSLATERISLVIEDAAAILGDFEIVSRLGIGEPERTGTTMISHDLVGIAFRLAGKRYQIDQSAGAGASALSIDGYAVNILEDADAVEEARVYLADHSFALPLGELALRGLDDVLQERDGASGLREALGMWLDCAGLGDQMAASCPTGDCAALGDALDEMCEQGLDRVVDEIETSFAANHFASVDFIGGEAALHDRARDRDRGDGIIDRVDRGHWNLVVSRDGEDASVAATGIFEGYRLGTEPGAQGPEEHRPAGRTAR